MTAPTIDDDASKRESNDRRGILRMLDWLRYWMPHPEVRGATAALAGCLVTHFDNDSLSTWVGLETLAEETGYSYESVKRARRTLVAIGALRATCRKCGPMVECRPRSGHPQEVFARIPHEPPPGQGRLDLGVTGDRKSDFGVSGEDLGVTGDRLAVTGDPVSNSLSNSVSDYAGANPANGPINPSDGPSMGANAPAEKASNTETRAANRSKRSGTTPAEVATAVVKGRAARGVRMKNPDGLADHIAEAAAADSEELIQRTGEMLDYAQEDRAQQRHSSPRVHPPDPEDDLDAIRAAQIRALNELPLAERVEMWNRRVGDDPQLVDEWVERIAGVMGVPIERVWSLLADGAAALDPYLAPISQQEHNPLREAIFERVRANP